MARNWVHTCVKFIIYAGKSIDSYTALYHKHAQCAYYVTAYYVTIHAKLSYDTNKAVPCTYKQMISLKLCSFENTRFLLFGIT